ncbi:MAG TPA: ornithine carbamoyltransferase [Thermoanaerobaculia bacterium]|jgi:ornithine carbamoyltransferase|nr:ornithine carbamoyltransferase [Thermoanaerobaculia bacterium]
MPVKHLLSISDVDRETIQSLVETAVAIAEGRWAAERPLAGRIVGIYFRKSSTRTRTSFTVAALKLGAQVITYGPNDLQIVTGESVPDTARVLANYLDALVIRTNETMAEMRELASQDRMAVVNAMSASEHPTQSLADLATLREHFGRLAGLHVLYLGEGNNSASAISLAVSRLPGMRLTLVTPEGYGLPADFMAEVRATAEANGSEVEQHHDMSRLPRGVDAVYTTRWLTMGVKRADEGWIPKFRPYTVTPAVMAEVSKPDGSTVFLHDLPAMRGYEVLDEVLDGPQSIAFRQAYHKMTSAMAVLDWCLAGG